MKQSKGAIEKLWIVREGINWRIVDERREELYAAATRTTTVLTGMPRGGHGTREDIYCELGDVADDYRERYARCEIK